MRFLFPSNADIWSQCPGSVGLIADLPDEPTTAAADEGTEAHKACECLLLQGHCDDFPEPMKIAAKSYVELIKSKLKDAALRVEAKIPFLGMNARIDCYGKSEEDKMYCFDYKYGKTKVTAKSSMQQLFYAVAISVTEKVEEVFSYIHQPRIKEPVNSHSFSKFEIDNGLRTFERAIVRTNLVKGDHCKWCPAKRANICPKWRER